MQKQIKQEFQQVGRNLNFLRVFGMSKKIFIKIWYMGQDICQLWHVVSVNMKYEINGCWNQVK